VLTTQQPVCVRLHASQTFQRHCILLEPQSIIVNHISIHTTCTWVCSVKHRSLYHSVCL